MRRSRRWRMICCPGSRPIRSSAASGPIAGRTASSARSSCSSTSSARARAGRCTTAAGTWRSAIEACASARATGPHSSVTRARHWRSSRYPKPSSATWSRLSRVSSRKSSREALEMSDSVQTGPSLTPAQQLLNDLWEEHVRDEFATRDTEATLATMVPDAYVNHVPVMTGGVGREPLREFYSQRFIPKMPADTEIVPVSRTIGTDRLVDELIFRFSHTVEMEWMLPDVPPTGRRVEIPLVVVIHFRDGKLAHEHIYWDQASVLVQLGLLDPSRLPIAGVDTARKVMDPTRPSNELIRRAEAKQSGPRR